MTPPPPVAATLIALLEAKQDDVIRRWRQRVNDDPLVPESERLSKPMLTDHIPEVLAHVRHGLQHQEDESFVDGQAAGTRIGRQRATKEHARLRFEQGYSIHAAMRELSQLRTTILELGTAEGVAISGEAALLLHTAIDEAMAPTAVQMARQEQELLKAIVEQTGEGIVVADEHGIIQLFNPAAERQHGIGLKGVPPAEWAETYGLLAPDGSKLPLEATPLYRAIHGEFLVNAPYHLRRADGAIRQFMTTATPLVRPDGTSAGAVLMIRDETERLLQEEALARAVQFRDLFIGILGHDLRNPLTAIIAFAGMMLERKNPDDAAYRTAAGAAFARITGGADRMNRMIQDTLDFTRGQLGSPMPTEMAPADLAAVCRVAVTELEAAHPERSISLSVTGDTGGIWHHDRLIQVVSNLIGNALSYSPADSPVTVTLQDLGPTVTLAVNNRGDAIPAGDMARLFDPFKRAQEANEGIIRKGLGLGLFICKSIVEAHGGQITVSSNPGDGTTFTVALPRHGGLADPPAQAS
ncbi:MAG: PAS domain S-box protein [Candidatus Sericytochromatia bacterium]|nr:PAS domain S-box protein [Candidatus Sericytochromatia bacterium]